MQNFDLICGHFLEIDWMDTTISTSPFTVLCLHFIKPHFLSNTNLTDVRCSEYKVLKGH